LTTFVERVASQGPRVQLESRNTLPTKILKNLSTCNGLFNYVVDLIVVNFIVWGGVNIPCVYNWLFTTLPVIAGRVVIIIRPLTLTPAEKGIGPNF